MRPDRQSGNLLLAVEEACHRLVMIFCFVECQISVMVTESNRS